MIPCYYVLMVPLSKREFYIYMANYTDLLELYPNLDSWETHWNWENLRINLESVCKSQISLQIV